MSHPILGRLNACLSITDPNLRGKEDRGGGDASAFGAGEFCGFRRGVRGVRGFGRRGSEVENPRGFRWAKRDMSFGVRRWKFLFSLARWAKKTWT